MIKSLWKNCIDRFEVNLEQLIKSEIWISTKGLRWCQPRTQGFYFSLSQNSKWRKSENLREQSFEL